MMSAYRAKADVIQLHLKGPLIAKKGLWRIIAWLRILAFKCHRGTNPPFRLPDRLTLIKDFQIKFSENDTLHFGASVEPEGRDSEAMAGG